MKQANYNDLNGTPPNSATCQGVIEGHLEKGSRKDEFSVGKGERLTSQFKLVRCAQEKIYLQNSHGSNRNCGKGGKRRGGGRRGGRIVHATLFNCNQVGFAVSSSLPGVLGPILRLPFALGPTVVFPGVIAATCLPIISLPAGVGSSGSRTALLPLVRSVVGAARFRTSGFADVLFS